jgi:hypothetical protein
MRLAWLPSTPTARRRCAFNLVGVLLLAAGLGSAAHIWRAQDRMDRQAAAQESSGTLAPLSPEDSRKYSRQMEIYSGKTGLLMEKWTRWLGEWAHGKPLAKVIAALSLLAAGGCFVVARSRPVGRPE